MVDKVDIRNLRVLNITQLEIKNNVPASVKEQMYSDRFKGSDLFYDVQEKTLKRIIYQSDGSQEGLASKAISFNKLEESVLTILSADTNQNGYLELGEARKLLTDRFGDGDPSKVVPQLFLTELQRVMTTRYNPIADNIRRIDTAVTFEPLIVFLREYNMGIFQEDVRHANTPFAYNGLTKSLTNGVLFLPVAAYNVFAPEEDEAPYLMGTHWALEAAKGRFERATQAIDRLKNIFLNGAEENQSWAFNAELPEALTHLSGEARDIIVEQLAGLKMYSILSLKDPKERIKKLGEFADGERPGFLGIGGGNTSDASFWNYTGDKRNIYMALSIYHYLSKKAKTPEPLLNDEIRQNARLQLNDIKGDGGGFANLFWVGLTNLAHVVTFGAVEPTPYRKWGDRDSMSGLGRFAGGLLALWGGHQGIKGIKEAWNLRRVAGTGEVLRVWARSMRKNPFKIFPSQAFAEAAALERPMAREATWLTRRFNKISEMILKPFRAIKKPFSLAYAKLLGSRNNAVSAVGKGMGKVGTLAQKTNSKLVHGILLMGILQYSDQALMTPVSPFEGDFDHADPTNPISMGFKEPEKRTFNLNRSQRLQDYDPQLSDIASPPPN